METDAWDDFSRSGPGALPFDGKVVVGEEVTERLRCVPQPRG